MNYTYKCKECGSSRTWESNLAPICDCGDNPKGNLMTRDYSAINIINPNGRENPIKVKRK